MRSSTDGNGPRRAGFRTGFRAGFGALAWLALFGLAATAAGQVTVQPKRVAGAGQYVAGRIRLAYARPERRVFKAPVLTDMSKPDVDLTPSINSFKLRVREQGSRNTCSVHALTFLLEFEYARQNLGLVANDLSEEYLNYATNAAAGNGDDGDFFYNINQGYQKYGHAMQAQVANKPSFDPNFKVEQKVLDAGAKNWPRLKADVIKENASFTADAADDSQPYGLTAAQLGRVISRLDQGRPVAVGMRWPAEGKFDTEVVHGVELMRNLPVADLTGGHSVVLVGYRRHKVYPGGGYFIFRNSWGEGFGNKGYGYVSFDYVRTHTADAVTYQ